MKQRKDGRYVKLVKYERGGQTIKKWFYGTSENDVIKQVAAYQVEVKEGRLFKEVAEEWREEHYKTLEYNTQVGYDKSYKPAVERFGDIRISKITPSAVNAYVLGLARQKYARKTVAHRLSVLSLIFKTAIIDGDIATNPAANITIPKGLPHTRREPPPDNEIDIIRDSVEQPFGLFAYLILYTGLRRSEALALRYSDIDLVAKVIHVRRSMYFNHNNPHEKHPKTECGTRDVVLLDKLAAVLPRKTTNDYIFTDRTGGPLTERQYQRAWKNYQKATGITATAHQLRHAFATMLYEADIPDKDAQELLGHADIYTTRNIYTHISKTRKQHIADKLNAHVK